MQAGTIWTHCNPIRQLVISAHTAAQRTAPCTLKCRSALLTLTLTWRIANRDCTGFCRSKEDGCQCGYAQVGPLCCHPYGQLRVCHQYKACLRSKKQNDEAHSISSSPTNAFCPAKAAASTAGVQFNNHRFVQTANPGQSNCS